jgi:hypothetical protein
MDMDMQYEHMQHGFGHAAWAWTVDMHGCMDAGMPIKSSVQHRLCSVGLQRLVSGIGIPASWSVRYRWSRINPLVPSYGKTYPLMQFLCKFDVNVARWPKFQPNNSKGARKNEMGEKNSWPKFGRIFSKMAANGRGNLSTHATVEDVHIVKSLLKFIKRNHQKYLS